MLKNNKTSDSDRCVEEGQRKRLGQEALGDTIPTGTKPRTSHYRSPGGESRAKRKRSTIFLERTRKGHRHSDEHWNRFRGNVGKTSERRGGARMGFSELVDTILN